MRFIHEWRTSSFCSGYSTQCPMDVSPGMETWLPCPHSSHNAFTSQLHAALFGLLWLPRQRKYLRTAVSSSLWSLKFLSRASIFPATSFPVFCPLGTRLWHQWLSWHWGPLSGTSNRGPRQKRSRMLAGVPSRLVSLESTNHPVQCYYLPCYLHLFLDKPAHVPCSLTTRSWRA